MPYPSEAVQNKQEEEYFQEYLEDAAFIRETLYSESMVSDEMIIALVKNNPELEKAVRGNAKPAVESQIVDFNHDYYDNMQEMEDRGE